MSNIIPPPTVSVIVPNYNHAPYLEERIESILAQDWTDFELILLDDCSPDNSREILERYRNHPHVSHIVYNEYNSGSTFKQWLKGIELARGEYIWIAESDDVAAPTLLSTYLEVVIRHSGTVLVYSGSNMIDPSGNKIEGMDWDTYEQNGKPYEIFHGKDFIRHHLLWKNEVYNASMVLFKKTCFQQVAQEYLFLRYCGDWLIWGCIAAQGEVIRCNQKLNFFRQHNNKVSPKAEKEGLYFKEGVDIMFKWIELLNLSVYQRRVFAGRLYKRLFKSPLGQEDREELAQKIRTKIAGNRWVNQWLYTLDKLLEISQLQ
jgi:glycosyltransferase involved in cell wall biosynthesis